MSMLQAPHQQGPDLEYPLGQVLPCRLDLGEWVCLLGLVWHEDQEECLQGQEVWLVVLVQLQDIKHQRALFPLLTLQMVVPSHSMVPLVQVVTK